MNANPAFESFRLPPPQDESVDALIIAGEHSGDEHAARMLKSARLARPELRVSAIGGRKLQAAGAQLLFDLTRFSVVGFVEVLKNLREGLLLRDEIVRWIREYRPKVVCFVDYPGFNLNLAQTLANEGLSNRAGGPVRLIYYISPQVWAWKKKRKFKMAEILDSLAVIFPFEVDVFEGTRLETRFVGHPFLASDYDLPISYDPDGPILLLPGSRKAAVGRIAPVLFSAFQETLKRKTKLAATCIYASEELHDQLVGLFSRFPDLRGKIDLQPNDAHVGARAALTSSGTMSLNCALANIPGAIVYRTHLVTYLMGRALVNIKYIGIANLLLDKPLYPEYIQGSATRQKLATELVDCMENVERIKQTRRWAAQLRELLDLPKTGGAADWLLSHVDR